MERLTIIFFSCRRLELLKQSVWGFVNHNNHPYEDFIIVNDSGDPVIWDKLRHDYEGATFVFNEKNEGLIKSIDNGYARIKTPWLFHCEDDWMMIRGGFIEKSLSIMKAHPEIEEVWPEDFNGHPIEPKIYEAGIVKYRLVADNYQKGQNGYNDFAWHGFTTACGLKRLADYQCVGPYESIPWQGTIWHREQAIGERYHDLGYRSAMLMDNYFTNIGYGQSEYVSGLEK